MHKHTEVLGMFWDRVAPLYDFFGNAFNRADYDGTGEAVARDDCVLECAFQASKVFLHGGPFVDLFNASSRAAKSDRRLRESGKLVGFKYFEHEFPLEPKTYFYDWLYASTLCRHDKLVEQVMMFDAFTDIEHNPERSINCQARSVAKVVGLARAGLLADALQSPRAFLELGYH